MEINLDRFLAITALLAAAGVTACTTETIDTSKDSGTSGSSGTGGTGVTGGSGGSGGADAATMGGSGGADAGAQDDALADQTASTDVSTDQATGDGGVTEAGQGDASPDQTSLDASADQTSPDASPDQASPDAKPDQISPDSGACLGEQAAADAGNPSDPCYELPTPSPSSQTFCTSAQDQCIQYAGRVKPAVFAKMLECLSTITAGDAGSCAAFDAASQKCIDDAFGLACLPTGTACDGIAAACAPRNEEYPDAGPVAADGGGPAFPGITAAACKRALAPLSTAEQAITVDCFNTAWASPFQSCESIFDLCVQSGSVE
jgi:hypothetical protein